MADDGRRIAADARRVAGTNREAAAEIRELFARNYERGREVGRDEVREEIGSQDARAAMLNLAADGVKSAEGRLAEIPNSGRAQTACREAFAILRDIATLGEVTPESVDG